MTQIEWVLILVLNFGHPLAPAVITGFQTQQDCLAAADQLHTLEPGQRLAPAMSSTCVQTRVKTK
jgi:hypothetical protein